MSYLFIDSTYDLYLGVLDDGLNWLSYEKHTGQKASAIIQSIAYEELEKFKITPAELSGVITVNGPGFYTGLRLAEGFADVFSFFGIKQFSFYSYEIPLWCGYKSGTWFTKAYRGEYFFYKWNEQTNQQNLIEKNDLEKNIGNEQFFIHSQSSLDPLSAPLIKSPIETSELLKKHSQEVFKNVLTGSKREPFYFRAPEDEFKVNP